MERKQFLFECGVGCLGLLTGSILLESCAVNKMIMTTKNDKNEVRISTDEFIEIKKDKSRYLRSIVIKVERMDYPIIIYRNTAENYQSFLLKCTHQGSVLSAYGDLISCPAHGSEFNASGAVIHGPATQQLASFPIQVSENEIIIKLS